jgi:hypothetical protein
MEHSINSLLSLIVSLAHRRSELDGVGNRELQSVLGDELIGESVQIPQLPETTGALFPE